ncbi:MAG: hypothetical protein AAF351_12310 [Pseudomonadota bacterium]
MTIDRRQFVGGAGFVLPGLAIAGCASAAESGSSFVLSPPADRSDATDAINAALREHGSVILQNGEYRVDGTIRVDKHQYLSLAHNAVLRRVAKDTDNMDPVVVLTGNRARLVGGRIVTENDHPRGVLTLGHHSASKDVQYNATQWCLSDCSIEGRQAPRNVGIWVPNAQAAHRSGQYANYFGFVQNVGIKGADVGILLDEVANAHRFFGVFFSHMIGAAWELRGAYANQIFGGFLHLSRDGVTGVRLRNSTSDKYHDSVYNSFYGFGIEPGGKSSSAYDIESRCRRNTLFLQSNVTGKSVDRNGENLISRHGGHWPGIEDQN